MLVFMIWIIIYLIIFELFMFFCVDKILHLNKKKAIVFKLENKNKRKQMK